MHRTTTRKMNVAFGLVLAILVALCGASYFSTNALISASDRVARTHEILARAEGLMSGVRDAETGQRGYLLTGETQYLFPYSKAIGVITRIERELRELTTDNPRQRMQLEKVKLQIESKLGELAETMRLYDGGYRQEALDPVRTAKGREIMDHIRSLIDDMEAEEIGLLQQRVAQEQNGIHGTLSILALGNALAFCLAGFAAVMVKRDLKARRRAEDAVAESEKRYRLLAENCTDLIARVSRDGRYKYASPACRGLLGYEPHELVGQDSRALIHPDDFDALNIPRFLSTVDENTAVLRYRMRRKDGTYVFFETSSRSLFDSADGGPGDILQVGRDISVRHKYECMLQEHKEEFRLLFEDAPVAYHEIDCHGTVQRVNRAECRLLGLEASQIVGAPVWNLVSENEREQSRAAVVQKLSGALESTVLSRQYARADGRLLTLEIHENLIHNADGGIVGIRSALFDVTERRLAESLERGYRMVLETIVQNTSLDVVLAQLAKLMEEHDPENRYSILLLRQNNLQRGAAPSLPEACIDAIERLPIGPIAGSCGAAAYWGKEVIAADVDSDPLWAELRGVARLHGVRACTSIPIFSGTGSVLGTLASYSRVVNKPSERDLRQMEYAARLASVAIEHRQLADQLAYQARHDALTGLPNRFLFEDRLQQALAVSQRQGTGFALLFIDLDGFKRVNDELGHSAGDELLRRFAERLQGTVRRSDTVARIGGDEFTVILNDIESREGATQVSEKIRRAFEQPLPLNGRFGLVRPSIGISVFPEDGSDSIALQRNADAAMYRVKAQRKERAILS